MLVKWAFKNDPLYSCGLENQAKDHTLNTRAEALIVEDRKKSPSIGCGCSILVGKFGLGHLSGNLLAVVTRMYITEDIPED